MGSSATNKPETPALLGLPPELRQQIYTYLIPQKDTSYPLPSVGINSISHRPPSLALLTIHPQLTAELLQTFYSLATWKLIFSHAFNFFRIDPELSRLESSPVLNHLRKIEIVFFCDILLLREYPSFGLEKFCAEIRRRAQRACEVLSKAQNLRSVTVSWFDTTCTNGWADKARILQPLGQLSCSGVEFRVGAVDGSEDVDRDIFTRALRDAVGEERFVEGGIEGAVEGPSHIRMLAFDLRQDRRPKDHLSLGNEAS